VRSHLVQYNIAWEDKPANHRAIGALIAGARIEPGDLLVLPEMFDTGFSLRVERTADHDGESARFLSELSARHRAYSVASITARSGTERARNRALVHDPDGKCIAQYDKMHPFTFGREGDHFGRGDRVVTFDWRSPSESLRVCPTVCYDLRFPELFRRGLTLGAEAYVVVANWPAERAAHWRALLIARAIENQAIVLAVNRCGNDPHLRYAGGSIAIDPRGRVMSEAGEVPTVLSIPFERRSVDEWRAAFPAWKDRHPGLTCQEAAIPGSETAVSS